MPYAEVSDVWEIRDFETVRGLSSPDVLNGSAEARNATELKEPNWAKLSCNSSTSTSLERMESDDELRRRKTGVGSDLGNENLRLSSKKLQDVRSSIDCTVVEW